MPAFSPRLYDLKVTPIFFHAPEVTSLPLTTPIDPVMVDSSAKMTSDAQAT